MKKFLSYLLPLFAIFTLTLGSVHAATFTVNSDRDVDTAATLPTDGKCEVDPGECTLREAIREANATPEADEIGFDGSFGGTGKTDLVLKRNLYILKPLTITGPGATNLTISGADSFTIFIVLSKLTVSNFTLAHGNVSGGVGGAIFVTPPGNVELKDSVLENNKGVDGGAILNFGTLTVDNSSFKVNEAESGGAISNAKDGVLTITNSAFEDNKAKDNGGAIANSSTAAFAIRNTQFTHNKADKNGGAIFEAGTLGITLQNTSFYTNKSEGSGGAISFNGSGVSKLNNVGFRGAHEASENGGVVAVHNGKVEIEDLVVQSAYAHKNGGAFYIFGGTTEVNFQRAIFFSNTAGKNGGALSVENLAVANLKNSTFSTNGASNHGGGIYVDTGISHLNNVSLVKNSADNGLGGGLRVVAGGNISVSNSLLTGNQALMVVWGKDQNCSGKISSKGHNLEDSKRGLSCAFDDKSKGDLQVADAVIDFTLSVENVHPLLGGSPAIDAGDPSTCEKTDQRGKARPLGDRCDIGAHESLDSATLPTLPAPVGPGPGPSGPVPPVGPVSPVSPAPLATPPASGSGTTTPISADATPDSSAELSIMGGGCSMSLGGSASNLTVPMIFAVFAFLGMVIIRKKA